MDVVAVRVLNGRRANPNGEAFGQGGADFAVVRHGHSAVHTAAEGEAVAHPRAYVDQHAVVAVAALRRLLVNEGLLQRMERRRLREPVLLRIERREALERRQRFVRDSRNRRNAGADLDAVGEISERCECRAAKLLQLAQHLGDRVQGEEAGEARLDPVDRSYQEMS